MKRNASSRDLKIQRIAEGAAPRALELCSGCGGMSLGLQTAGFDLAAHIEADAAANATHALNFAPTDDRLRKIWAAPRDMVATSLNDLVEHFQPGVAAPDAFDIIAAGLPCQAFARIGRSKLRSVTGDEQAFRNDPRASLYRRFIQFVENAKPLAIIVENVPDILNFGGHNIPEEISQTLHSLGYESRYTLLNAAFYGVPQLRERLFLVAIDASLGIQPSFPAPTHFIELPRGYEGSRNVALKHVQIGASHYIPTPAASRDLPSAVSAHDALEDLPFLSGHLREATLRQRNKVSDRRAYRDDRDPSTFALAMRQWPGFESRADIDGNAIRLTARDYPIFGRMPRGGDYPVALRIANELLQEKLEQLTHSGRRPSPGSARYARLEAGTIPPYDVSKFPNKWWKLVPDAPSRTLTAHLGKDTYSHIHYDGRQKRMISVREAARLQSFPDGFKFAGQMNASFRQIGNAVPPLLALAVGRELLRTISQAAASLQGARRLRAA
jgi:DNA (cytosine-5)-methyltransferase 1